MKILTISILLSLVSCGYQLDSENQKNVLEEDHNETEEYKEIGTADKNEITDDKLWHSHCDRSVDYRIGSKYQTWEETGINAPYGYRLIERYEFIWAFDNGEFLDYGYSNTSYWTMTQNLQAPHNPIAVSISSSSHQTYGLSVKLLAIYISTCDFD